MRSILRVEEEKMFSELSLSGQVLDLGGEKSSHYLDLVQGVFTVTTVNLHKETGCDVVHDLEKFPLPFEDASYDAVILNNTLEHVYHARELVSEAVRVLKKGGKIIITVPFLFPVHPSPHDYWRFTKEALQKLLGAAGLTNISVKALGTGVFTVNLHLFERLLPYPFRVFMNILRPIARACDVFFFEIRKESSVRKRDYYCLGYFVVGEK